MNVRAEGPSYYLVFVFSMLLASAIGYFLGVELNPKPTQVTIEKTIEKKILEKRVPVEVVVEKHINPMPNTITRNGHEIDCYETEKLNLMPARSKWKPLENPFKDDEDPDRSYMLARTAEREAVFNVSKLILIDKITCRLELNNQDFELLAELVNRP